MDPSTRVPCKPVRKVLRRPKNLPLAQRAIAGTQEDEVVAQRPTSTAEDDIGMQQTVGEHDSKVGPQDTSGVSRDVAETQHVADVEENADDRSASQLVTSNTDMSFDCSLANEYLADYPTQISSAAPPSTPCDEPDPLPIMPGYFQSGVYMFANLSSDNLTYLHRSRDCGERKRIVQRHVGRIGGVFFNSKPYAVVPHSFTNIPFQRKDFIQPICGHFPLRFLKPGIALYTRQQS